GGENELILQVRSNTGLITVWEFLLPRPMERSLVLSMAHASGNIVIRRTSDAYKVPGDPDAPLLRTQIRTDDTLPFPLSESKLACRAPIRHTVETGVSNCEVNRPAGERGSASLLGTRHKSV